MSDDLKCAICGEPWNAFGVRPDGMGDMAGWEAELFLKGAGCPCCEGFVDEETDSDKLFEDFGRSLLSAGLDDFGHFSTIEDGSLDEPKPEWSKPDNPVVKECEGCGLKLVRDLEVPKGDEDGYLLEGGHPALASEDCLEPDEWVPVGGHLVCPDCRTYCSDCDTDLFQGPAADAFVGDTYDVGASFPDPGGNYHNTLCIECFEARCIECGSRHEDCTCSAEDSE